MLFACVVFNAASERNLEFSLTIEMERHGEYVCDREGERRRESLHFLKRFHVSLARFSRLSARDRLDPFNAIRAVRETTEQTNKRREDSLKADSFGCFEAALRNSQAHNLEILINY